MKSSKSVKNLLSINKVSSFSIVLKKLKDIGVDIYHAIDGGAGSGASSKAILSLIGESCYCYSFEPFEGNHRFFPKDEPRLVLIKKALASKNGTVLFHVPAVVTENNLWGQRGMVGYSSGGRIVDKPTKTSDKVESVRADDVIPIGNQISFIKLDLQGGELPALLGMPRILDECYFLWIEFMGQEDLFEFLVRQDFEIFDTQYLFYSDPSPEYNSHFEVSKTGKLSNDRTVYYGYRTNSWNDYLSQFNYFKKNINLIQTDLVCVKKSFMAEFHRAFNN